MLRVRARRLGVRVRVRVGFRVRVSGRVQSSARGYSIEKSA